MSTQPAPQPVSLGDFEFLSECHFFTPPIFLSQEQRQRMAVAVAELQAGQIRQQEQRDWEIKTEALAAIAALRDGRAP